MKKTEKMEKILVKVKQHAPIIFGGICVCCITVIICNVNGFQTGLNTLSAAILYDHDEAMNRLKREYANVSKEDMENTVKYGKYVLENWLV